MARMSSLVCRGVALGVSLVWELDRRGLLRGTSRSAEAARYIDRALDATALLPLRDDRYLDDAARGKGRATLWLPAALWRHVDTTAERLGVSVSEAARVLVYAGLALVAPEPDLPAEDDFAARLRGAVGEGASLSQVAGRLWPRAPLARARHAARRLLLSSTEIERVEAGGRSVWRLKPEGPSGA